MKKFFALSLVTMSALFVLTIFSLMQNTPAGYLVPVNEEIYTAGDFDQLRIRKPTASPLLTPQTPSPQRILNKLDATIICWS